MKFYRLLVTLFLFSLSFVHAVERIGPPISPSLWSSYLPNATHPSYASNLGALREGRLTFGFQDSDLAHLSLSVPGLQIISANTRWQTTSDQSRWFYDSKRAHLADDAYYRDLFLVAGGARLSNIISLKNWDLGIGGTFKSLAIENEDEEKYWKSYVLGTSFSLVVNSWLLSGSWDKYEQRYLFAYSEPGDWQAGLELYYNLEGNYSFGMQPGAEYIFYEGIKVHGGFRWQFAEFPENKQLRRVEFMLNLGASMRFRPYRKTDPEWLRSFITPLNSAIFYDWEVSFESNFDAGYGASNWVVSISKWF
ncbi:MAG: hypothetical protein LBU89_14475 [Fibromonadaceae bacterium]|jgi:hypothetical protein|nr:hypothetical protein [Fibromonadaceae bacterium]